ncbi:hypothetical protein Hanom_Chr16g01458981 [Helianthus anomalus]
MIIGEREGVYEREGIVGWGPFQSQPSTPFFLSLPLHQVSNHCQHFSAKFKHFSLIDVGHSDWLIFYELQILSFIFIPYCKRCPLSLKLISFVLNVSKYCTLCPLALTQLDIIVKSDHVTCT